MSDDRYPQPLDHELASGHLLLDNAMQKNEEITFN